MKWLGVIAGKFRTLLSSLRAGKHGKCGAIALHSVYKRLGLRSSISEIWTRVKLEDASGGFISAGHSMCRHALNRGLHAVYLTARYDRGIALLGEAREQGIEVILNHVSLMNPKFRHFSILKCIAGDRADLFDPTGNTSSTMSASELLDMWGKLNEEGGGHTLLAVSKPIQDSGECESCGHPIPAEVPCPNHQCRQAVPMEPRWLLGCANRECPAANWELLRCPSCGEDIEDLKSWSPW